MERLVQYWADYELYHYSGNRYGLTTHTGEPCGGDIYASNDQEAIKKAIFNERRRWEKEKGKKYFSQMVR
jgi:hypothetical protein